MAERFTMLIPVYLVLTPISLIVLLAQEPAGTRSHTHSHQEANQVFFKINGQQPVPYLPTRSSAENFVLPTYLIPTNFMVNETIDIEIDPGVLETAAIKAHKSTIPDAKFIWDFGDAHRAEGVRNKHSYSKPGSYILGVSIESKLFDAPQLFKTVLIHILTNKDYQLPKAVIEVNNQLVPENFHNTLKTSFKEPIHLSGKRSISGSSRITDYVWDLSDRTLSREAKLAHTYNEASYNATPILRVRDSNGFFSDAYVEIVNLDTSSVRKETLGKATESNGPYYLIILAGLVVAALLVARHKYLDLTSKMHKR